MIIEVLCFEGCPNRGAAVTLVERVAAELGVITEIREVEVRDQTHAERLRFLGSPTVRVDGVDREPEGAARTDYALCCRTYGRSGVPPRDRIVAAIEAAQP